jgi:hypothetical protein
MRKEVRAHGHNRDIEVGTAMPYDGKTMEELNSR